MVKWIKNVTREVTLFHAVDVAESFGKTSKAFDIPFNYKHILFVDNTWWYPEEDYKTIQSIFKKKIEEDSSYIFTITKKQREKGEKLKQYVKQISRQRFSRREIVYQIKDYNTRMTEFYSFWWIAIPLGDILESKIKKYLTEKKLS